MLVCDKCLWCQRGGLSMGTVWICKEFISVTICCYGLTVTVSLGGCLSVRDKRDERESGV